MSKRSDLVDLSENSSVVSFSRRLLGSPAFRELFDNGMSLVEEAANYLDGVGRMQSKMMERAESLAYSTESMRLTTRLMQLASWLLLQRAVSEGEMTIEQAQEEQRKVKLSASTNVKNSVNWEQLPDELKDLIERSLRLQEQVVHFDDALNSTEAVQPQEASPLAGHMTLLNEAFRK